MHAIRFKTLRGNAIYYTLDNRIELSNVFDAAKEFDLSFEASASFIHSRIEKFVVELTQQCTLRCSYCCYSGQYEGMRSHSPLSMSEETLKKTIEFIGEHCNKEAEKVHVNLYGGEALICFDKVEFLVSELRRRLGGLVQFSISTNGLALTPAIVDWICSVPNVQVMVSVDGDKEMHDACRKTIQGKGSYDQIVANLLSFKDKYPKEYQERVAILATLRKIEDAEMLSDRWRTTPLSDKLPIIISLVSPNFSNGELFLPRLSDLAAYYKKAFAQYVRGEKTLMTRSLQTLVDTIKNRDFELCQGEHTIYSCLNDMHRCYIDTNGTLYACEKVCMEQSVGNLWSGFDQQRMRNLTFRYVERLNRLCSQCWAVRLCPKCMVTLNYSEDEQRQLCEIERGKALLALKYYCLVQDLNASRC
ncbi:MAG: radical SAM protein [Bacteroidaceae bacterium]|nr:radical SAM protein [Bacteroidaceae bacterium]